MRELGTAARHTAPAALGVEVTRRAHVPFMATLLAALALGIGALPSAALAQEPPPPATDAAQLPTPMADDVEEVVVTGSRILRDPNLGSIAPVKVVPASALALSGQTDITEVLNNVPALLGSTTASGGDGAFLGDGTSVLELRNLGPERTLVLINGRRHVGGVAGEQSVDIGSIPPALIERVEVLTGGASAIYGADAVTGVVNFILKEDHEGFDLRLRGGSSGRGDADSFDASGLWGVGFLGGRGNLTLASNVSRNENLRADDRRFSRNNRVASDSPNPALRFQVGEISAARTPNLARFFDPARGEFPRGSAIPSEADFLASFRTAFGADATLTDAERALLRRAAGAPPRAMLRRSGFASSSISGVIAPRDFDARGLDTDGNGVDDCMDSFVGFNSRRDNLGGCFTVGRDGRVRPLRDGRIADGITQSGGDGTGLSQNVDFLTPEDDRYTLNLTSRIDLNELVSAFGEAKYSFSKTDSGNAGESFADLLQVGADNPYIPQVLQQLARDAGGLLVTRDFTDLGRNLDTTTRRTARFVGGLKGNLPNGWNYEVSGNYGTFRSEFTDRARVIQDRLFAALDVTTDAQGRPVCRSELTRALPPGSLSRIPLFDAGFFTFRPGEGRCKPADIFGGPGSISREAASFISQTVRSSTELEQLVFSAVLSGDSSSWFELPGGAVGFSSGLEFRDERSSSRFDPLELGVLPSNGPSGKKGQLIGKLPGGFQQKSLVFDPETARRNTGGSFDVREAFAELSLPLLRGARFAEELTLSGATRFSDYSTVGSAFTWNLGASYAPVSDLRLRTSLAHAVRAPNIDELFSPAQGAFFMPQDPCEKALIDALRDAGDPRGERRAANCKAAGIPEDFSSPLTARISGLSSGNPDLGEETGRTWSLGAVLQPRWVDGLSLSADFFDIRIQDAIASVSDQDIVNGCFDGGSFPSNPSCALFTRNMDPNSPQFRAINFVRQTELNFAALETSGLDLALRYEFDWRESVVNIGLSGTQVFKLDRFFDPADSSAVDPELGETGRPEFAGSFDLSLTRGPLSLHWQTQYLGEQTSGPEIETARELFGRDAFSGETYIHDFAFEYRLADRIQISGGVDNVTNVQPLRSQTSFPVSAVGRYLFFGVQLSY